MDTFELEPSLLTVIGEPGGWKIYCIRPRSHVANPRLSDLIIRLQLDGSGFAAKSRRPGGNDPCRKSLVSKRQLISIGSQPLVKLVGPVEKIKSCRNDSDTKGAFSNATGEEIALTPHRIVVGKYFPFSENDCSNINRIKFTPIYKHAFLYIDLQKFSTIIFQINIFIILLHE